MEEKNFTAIITEEGSINIPNEVFENLRMHAGDTLTIAYEQPTEEIECCLFIENHQDKDHLDAYMCIPKVILNECGIDAESDDLHMLCFDEEITITTGNKMLHALPAVMLKLCDKLDIPKEVITKLIAEECCGKK